LQAEFGLNELRDKRDEYAKAMQEYDKKFYGARQGTWFPTYYGKRFWPEDPQPEDIDIRDISHALARLNRYCGHTRHPYSVAQHCVLGSLFIGQTDALAFLMHDAAEAYLNDIITPVKRLLGKAYDSLETNVLYAVAKRFGFDSNFHAEAAVKRMDIAMLATELRDLVPHGMHNGVLTELPLESKITKCWSAEEAEKRFLDRFEELTCSKTQPNSVNTSLDMVAVG
jgi:5'-deoxynucleotidase YfbR-like HD superfamily hydrolase